MDDDTLSQARDRLRPYVEQARDTAGWAFPFHARPLRSRAWDYDARARALISGATRVLDIGTGGGERLSGYLQNYRGLSVATERWQVNAPIAAARLKPLGVHVVNCDDEHLPFAAASFDLVLNRHAGLDPADAARLLRPGGTLYTEQVWDHWRELKRFIPRMQAYRGHYRAYREGLTRAGLALIDARDDVLPAAFANLGELVFMLCVTPWTVPDFDPLQRDLEALLALEAALTTPDGLVLSDGAFIIEARAPEERSAA